MKLSLRKVLALLALALTSSALAQAPPLLLGTAWYPEQWPESVWDRDLQTMQEAGMHVVRVGEFAWSTMEPTEGRFDFTWLDHAIDLAARHGISTVLGTPSAAPPAWLTSKYPQTLRINENGRTEEHGGRQQFSSNDAKYRELSARVAREMAQRYGHNPHVLGWQIDNEIGAPTFDDSAKQQWHAWLARKYGTVANLNARWTTAYWSQTYDTFDEVPFHSRDQNPALLLDYKHFTTDTWVSFVDNQVNVIRPLADKRQFITTNTMHWYSTYDHYAMHKNLDIAAWDDYFPDGHLDPQLNGILHDLVRGYKRQNFWVMETQPAFVNWGPVNSPLPPGVTREMAWQAVAHGADAVLYWQWRSALNGQEQYHGTLVGPDGKPVPVYAEIAKLGAEFATAGPALAGTSPTASVAFLQDYDSHWALDFQRHSRDFDYTRVVTDWYRAVQPQADGIDVVSTDAPLAKYKVVFAPALNVLPEATAQRLRAYVEQGGTLVLGPRSGMKDEYDGLWPQRQPGPLASLLGAHVEEYYALDTPHDPAPTLSGSLGSGTASVWAEVLTPNDPATQTILQYSPNLPAANGWLSGHAAAVSRKAGKGTVIYIGAVLDAAFTRAALGSILTQANIHPLIPSLPQGVELERRATASGPNARAVWIAINHTAAPQHITLPQARRNVLAEGSPSTTLDLDPHGIAVLVQDRNP